MASIWLEALQTAGFDAAYESSGNLQLDAEHAAKGTVIAPLAHLGLIRAEGDDALGFLHNLLTNDVNSLEVNGLGESTTEKTNEKTLRRAGFCTPKGRMLADFLLWRHVSEESNGVTLQLSAELLPPILKKLSMYVLRSKVKLTDASDSFARIGLAGPQSAALLLAHGLPQPGTMQQQAFDAGTVLCLDAQRFEIVIAAGKAAALWQSLSKDAQPVGTAAWRGLDIAAGIPAITAATVEAFVPQMVNYELIGGISFKKGCYPGQEIVARTHYLGKIKRRMYRAHLAEDSLAPGTSIYAPETGDQACGSIVTVAPSASGGTDCLLVAQSSVVAAGEIHVGSPTGPAAQILPLPYAVE